MTEQHECEWHFLFGPAGTTIYCSKLGCDKSLTTTQAEAMLNEYEKLKRATSCEWKYDEFHDVWETSCDNLWQFNSDGPEENECKYCMYCGGGISVADILGVEDETRP